ncbi:TnsA endonuclease C-terminal domain-containing protein [Anoxynatronum buryatiense]|uniref:TnsA endonuclease N terminal n=1 Tax=Anoxynatronum buryatiense TaxID=489973 RepID=A0AA45WZ79_9CLOT|nr:TnsA endonuclease C-terminal domain-containing protein [Anoxynatronum buryatiense]SMP72027.1 TnsA endonuclease N terminal [Anoxynatronum buryatiense]
MKRNKDWNQAKYERFLKDGRGSGNFAEYKPWLTIQDMPSMGRVTRVYGYTTGRIHHFFSDIQTRYFYLLEYSPYVIDIKEHYPLLDAQELLRNQDVDIEKHVGDDGTPYVFTSTFLIRTKTRDGFREYARAVKSHEKLETKNVIERFEIERRYWEAKGIDWGIVTNKEIPKVMVKNIEWLHPAMELKKYEVFEANELEMLCDTLLRQINTVSKKMRFLLNDFDEFHQLECGTGINLFKYMVWKHQIHVDIESKIDLGKLMSSELKLNDSWTKGGTGANESHG